MLTFDKNKITVARLEWIGRDYSEDLGVDGKMILEWILGKRIGDCGLDLSRPGYGPVARCFEHGAEPSGSMKGEEFLDW